MGKFGPEIQNFLFIVKFGSKIIEYAEFNGAVHVFCFGLGIPFLGKFGSILFLGNLFQKIKNFVKANI